MTRLGSATAAAAAVALAISGSAGAHADARPHGSAGRFMVKIVREKVEGRYDLAWQRLYPLHQQVASLDAYVACESLVPSPGTLAGVRVLRTFGETIQVAGQPQPIKTRAVRLRIRILSSVWPVPIAVVQTFHAIAVSGRWTWILSSDQYDYYSAGVCPYA
jgi:hypothetical protein